MGFLQAFTNVAVETGEIEKTDEGHFVAAPASFGGTGEVALALGVVADGESTSFDGGGIHEGSYHVLLTDVLITNREPRRVSLMPYIHIMVTPGAFGAGAYFPAQAETKPYPGDARLGEWLFGPIEIEPDSSKRGYLWFTIGEGDMINIKGDPKTVFSQAGHLNRLVLRDMVSGKKKYTEVPTLGYVHMDL